MISEIEKQLARIKAQIEAEKQVHDVWTKYMDCDIKTKVIHQAIGMVRGLEVAKESLEYILKQEPEQMTTDEWLLHDQKMKRIAGQVDNRGGIVRQMDYDGEIFIQDVLNYHFPNWVTFAIDRETGILYVNHEQQGKYEMYKGMYLDNEMAGKR